jgi:hypothetical protein
MFTIDENNTMIISKGETASFDVKIYNTETNSVYEMSATDTLTLAVKENIEDSSAIFSITSTGVPTLTFESGVTINVASGEYRYDIKLTTSGGQRYYIIKPSIFRIIPTIA